MVSGADVTAPTQNTHTPPKMTDAGVKTAASAQNLATPRKMTVADAVLLSLQNNLDLQSAYLTRVTDKMTLRVAEDKFVPQSSLVLSSGVTNTLPLPTAGVDGSRSQVNSMDGKLMATLNVPTGGAFAFVWDNPVSNTDIGTPYTYGPSWTLTFTQPLLKNAGIDVGTASVVIAKITEETNVLNLRDSIIGTINTTIKAYRTYVSALWDLEIAGNALASAKRLIEVNRAMIAAGRMAEMEIIQAESDLANWELGVTNAKNTVDQARLAFIQTMNIDRKTPFEVVLESEIRVRPPAFQDAMTLALQSRTDYLRSLKQLEISKLNLTVAKRFQLWDLSFVGMTSQTTSDSTYGGALRPLTAPGNNNWGIGLNLTIPLRDLTIEQQLVIAKVALGKQQLSLKKSEMDIEIAVQNALRNVEQNYRQMELSRQARVLAEKKLSIEGEKMKAGRTTNFQLVIFQNDLRTNQVAEARATINYLNSLTDLDTTLGTTLATWRVDVSDQREGRKSPDQDKNGNGKKDMKGNLP